MSGEERGDVLWNDIDTVGDCRGRVAVKEHLSYDVKYGVMHRLVFLGGKDFPPHQNTNVSMFLNAVWSSFFPT